MWKNVALKTYHRYYRTDQRTVALYHCDPLVHRLPVKHDLTITTTYHRLCVSKLRASVIKLKWKKVNQYFYHICVFVFVVLKTTFYIWFEHWRKIALNFKNISLDIYLKWCFPFKGTSFLKLKTATQQFTSVGGKIYEIDGPALASCWCNYSVLF